MVDSIGSMANNSYYQTLYKNYQAALAQRGGSGLSFQMYLRQLNVDYDTVMQGFENVIETGDARYGDGTDGNTLSTNRYVNGANNKQMYQTEDLEGYYEIDWNSGEYKHITDTQTAAAALGLDTETYNFDTIVLGQNSAEVTDFVFSDLSDGQQRQEYTVNGSYRNITYAVQEFDPCYILDSALQDATDEEYQKALNNWEYLSATVTQWISESELEALNALEPNSAEYKQALIDIILDKLDQTGSFGDHTHVENTNTVNPIEEIAGTETDVTTSESSTGVELEYDKTQVIKDSGIYNEYLTGSNWTGEWHEDGGRSNKRTNRDAAIVDGRNFISQTLDVVISNLQAQVGDAWTEEIADYAEKAKDEILAGFVDTSNEYICDDGKIKDLSEEWLSRFGIDHVVVGATDCKAGGAQDARAVVKYDNLIDEFFNKFDKLCETNGKTEAEIEAEEAERERLKGEYETFYNYDVKTASVGNIKAEYTVSMMGGNYKSDAENNVINPYKEAAIKAIKEKCPNIDDAQIEKLINAAASAALNKTSWLTTNGNIATGGTYTINTDKLLDEFNAQIKEAIKTSGAYNPDEA